MWIQRSWKKLRGAWQTGTPLGSNYFREKIEKKFMSPLEITASLEVLQLSIESIEDDKVRAGLVGLLNLVEALAQENATLREENQRLKDEINRLKGEQGKPGYWARSIQ
jgi:cell division protein FtsB